MRKLRNRRFMMGLLMVPLVALFLIVREQLSWRPRVLPHSSAVMALSFSPDGTLLASASVGKVVLWDAKRANRVRTLPVNPLAWFRSATFSGDGQTLATAGSGRGAQLWDVQTGELRRSVENQVFWTDSCALSPDGMLVVGWSLGSASFVLWDAQTGKLLHRVQVPRPTKSMPNPTPSQGLSIDTAAFSPDGKTLVTAGWSGSRQNGELHLWDIQTRKLRRTIGGFACGRWGVPSVAFSSDGKHLMWAAARTAKVWDATTGQMMRTLRGHEDEVMAVAFAPDSRTIASASGTSSSSIGQYRIRLWDLQTGGLLRTISRSSEARCLGFSPDGFMLASGHTDAALRLWRIK